MSWSKFVAPNSWGVPCFTVDFTVLFANLISECICKIKETEHFFSMLAPPAFSPNVSFFWPLCYFQKSKETTVGGSEILHRSVGSLSHYCDGLLYIPGGRAWDFWSIKSDRFQKKRVETRLPWRFSNLRRCCWLMCNDKYRATFLNNPFPLKTSTETSWKKNMPGCLGNLLGMKY